MKGMAMPERLVSDPGILDGKPVIRSTNISAELVLELLAAGSDHAEIMEDYPGVTEEDILACLSYAAQLAREWKSTLSAPNPSVTAP